MMVLLAVTAITLNRRAALQSRMASNQISSIQTALERSAVIEQSIWELTKDPMWRTVSGGENYTYNGTTYNRKVLSSSVTGYTDAVIATVTAPGAASGTSTAFRYYLEDIFYLTKPNQIYVDTWGNVYIADSDNHSILKVDGITSAVTRVVCTGSSGFSGDGGAATSAKLDTPRGVWLDSSGIIYIADTKNDCIRKVDLAGNISTFAGIGTQDGFSGDGGAATSAKLNNPRGVFADTSGDVYIADTDNHAIRRVDASDQKIYPFAGTGTQAGFSGDGGAATSAKLNKPRGVFGDTSGNIYIADTNNHCIRKVDTSGDISTFAGIGTQDGFSGDGGAATSAKLNNPRGVFGDTSGNIYIADTDNHCIRKVDTSGDISTFAGIGTQAGFSGDGGAATSAELDNPRGIFLKSTGELVIADASNACLREVSTGNVISTLTGTGDPAYITPEHITMDSNGNVYIADKDNHRIRKLDTTDKVTTVAGTGTAGFSGDGWYATLAQLDSPEGVHVDSSGNIYIVDSGASTNVCRLRKVDTSNPPIISLIAGKPGSGSCIYDGEGNADAKSLDGPRDVFVDNSGNIFIADTNSHIIRKITSGIMSTVVGTPTLSGYTGDGGAATSARLDSPEGVFKDSAGNIYIADTGNHCIRMVNTSGNISTVAGTGGPTNNGYTGDGGAATSAKLDTPVDVFKDSNGNLFIADQGNHVIRVVSAQDNKIYTLAGTGTNGYNGDDQPAVEAQLNSPSGLVMASTRGGLKIYLSDSTNNRIRTLEFRIEKKLY